MTGTVIRMLLLAVCSFPKKIKIYNSSYASPNPPPSLLLLSRSHITHQSHFHCSSRQAQRYLVSFSLQCSSLAAFGCLRLSTLKPFSNIAAASPMISTDESSATVGAPLAEPHQQPNQAVAPKGRCGTWALSSCGRRILVRIR